MTESPELRGIQRELDAATDPHEVQRLEAEKRRAGAFRAAGVGVWCNHREWMCRHPAAETREELDAWFENEERRERLSSESHLRHLCADILRRDPARKPMPWWDIYNAVRQTCNMLPHIDAEPRDRDAESVDAASAGGMPSVGAYVKRWTLDVLEADDTFNVTRVEQTAPPGDQRTPKCVTTLVALRSGD